MGPARRNKARRPPSEPEQKAGTPVRTQGRTAEGFHRRRRQAQPVPSPGLRLPELFQTERFIGVYHTPIFIKMQSFFSEIAWNSTQKLPAVRLHRQTKGARAPPGARAAHASIQFASEPRSAAAAAVISTAAAVPAATGIPTAPAVPTAAAEDDDQHDDPQAASAAPAVIAAPHIEVPPEDEDLRRRCAALSSRSRPRERRSRASSPRAPTLWSANSRTSTRWKTPRRPMRSWDSRPRACLQGKKTRTSRT